MKCKFCGHDISDTDTLCPGCDKDVKELKNGEFPYETLLNVLLCIPLGLTLPLTKKEISYKHVILVGLIVSLTTETLQLFTHRGDFETKDIIMNTLGTVIGYTIYRKILEKR